MDLEESSQERDPQEEMVAFDREGGSLHFYT